jgi:hypothetical protein
MLQRTLITVRRLFFALALGACALWVQSEIAPCWVTVTFPVKDTSGGDLAQADEYQVTDLVSSGGRILIQRAKQWQQSFLKPPGMITCSRSTRGINTLGKSLPNRLGFETYSGADPDADAGVIFPIWFVLLVAVSAYASVFAVGRLKRRGFPVGETRPAT